MLPVRGPADTGRSSKAQNGLPEGKNQTRGTEGYSEIVVRSPGSPVLSDQPGPAPKALEAPEKFPKND
ncbi:MAG TPA: hypothetical protein DEA96_17135 [Leptospiraceae bacterium]|nr:hypothetical protein [Spirochaetaceae bacterium]HBS06696.1 hypothetical protein [Leptospiraceae bacterium]